MEDQMGCQMEDQTSKVPRLITVSKELGKIRTGKWPLLPDQYLPTDCVYPGKDPVQRACYSVTSGSSIAERTANVYTDLCHLKYNKSR